MHKTHVYVAGARHEVIDGIHTAALHLAEFGKARSVRAKCGVVPLPNQQEHLRREGMGRGMCTVHCRWAESAKGGSAQLS